MLWKCFHRRHKTPRKGKAEEGPGRGFRDVSSPMKMNRAGFLTLPPGTSAKGQQKEAGGSFRANKRRWCGDASN